MTTVPNSKIACVCDSSAYALSLSIVPDISFKLPAGTLFTKYRYDVALYRSLDSFIFVFFLKI
jgi:hypothetical protein